MTSGQDTVYDLIYLGKELLIQNSVVDYNNGKYIIRDSNTGVFYFIGIDESRNMVIKKYNPISNTISIMGIIKQEYYNSLLLNSDSSKFYVVIEYYVEIGIAISVFEYDIETWTETNTILQGFGGRIETNILLDDNGFIWFCESIDDDYVLRRFDTNTNTTIDTSLNLIEFESPTSITIKDGFVNILTQVDNPK